jgi:uncharacterized membrane protein YkoI
MKLAAQFSMALCICLSVSAGIPAQKSKQSLKLEDLPAPVQKAVHEQSEGAEIRNISKEMEKGKLNYEVEMKANGHNKDILVDSTGKVTEVEEQVEVGSLSPEVQEDIKKAAGGGQVRYVESLMHDGKLTSYEVHILANGKKMEKHVSPAGKILPAGQE